MRTASRRAAAGSTRFASVCHTETHMESGDGQPMATATRPPTPDRTAVAGTQLTGPAASRVPRSDPTETRDAAHHATPHIRSRASNTRITTSQTTHHNTSAVGHGASTCPTANREACRNPSSRADAPHILIQSSNHPITQSSISMRGGHHVRKQCAADATSESNARRTQRS